MSDKTKLTERPSDKLHLLVGNPCDDCKNKIVSYGGFDGYPALYPDYYCYKNYCVITAEKTGSCAGKISNDQDNQR